MATKRQLTAIQTILDKIIALREKVCSENVITITYLESGASKVKDMIEKGDIKFKPDPRKR